MKGISPRPADAGRPAGERRDVFLGDEAVALMAQGVLQQDPDGERQPVEASLARLFERFERVDGDFAAAQLESLAARWGVGLAHLDLPSG